MCQTRSTMSTKPTKLQLVQNLYIYVFVHNFFHLHFILKNNVKYTLCCLFTIIRYQFSFLLPSSGVAFLDLVSIFDKSKCIMRSKIIRLRYGTFLHTLYETKRTCICIFDELKWFHMGANTFLFETTSF